MSKRNQMHTAVRSTALGGVTAALAVVIMCLGGLIPFSTFVCPMLCMLMLQLISRQCGGRMGWAWYGAVAILAVLLGPDKEASALFLFLGYYPLVKPWLERLPLPWLWKVLLFNVVIMLMYRVLIGIFGMAALADEFEQMGNLMLGITLVLGNVTFVLLDRLLEKKFRRRRRK